MHRMHFFLHAEALARCPATEQGVAPEAVAEAFHAFEQGSKVAPLTAANISNQSIQESMRLLLMVRAYQVSACCALMISINDGRTACRQGWPCHDCQGSGPGMINSLHTCMAQTCSCMTGNCSAPGCTDVMSMFQHLL